MKCLGILASPRKGHATDMMIDAVLAGLRDSGCQTEKVSLYDYNIKPCTGCCACQDGRPCVIEDDHRGILEKMGVSDVVVFGSPAYWSNVTSEAKKFMDRSAGFFRMTPVGPKRSDPKPSHAVIITACGAPYPFSHLMGIVPGAMGAMKVFFGRMNAKVHPIYAAGMIDSAKSLPSGPVIRKARNLGQKIGRDLV